MLFDPRSPVSGDDAAQSTWTSAGRHTPAQRRLTHDFLTLPGLTANVPREGVLTFGDEADMSDLVLSQFTTGVLRASDVTAPTSAGHALAQAMFVWLQARMPECRRLQYSLSLIDIGMAQDQLFQFGWGEDLEAPLYLAIETPGEEIYFIGKERADEMRAAHPALLYTAMSLVTLASSRSLHLRTPEVLLDLFARWHWDYDSTLRSDDDAREHLASNYGEGNADIERYLPSVVRPELAPDDVLPGDSPHLPYLSGRKLRAMGKQQNGWLRALCAELADLSLLLDRQGERGALEHSQWAEPAYSAAAIAYCESDYVGEVLDDLYEGLNSGGDATMFQCFVPIASEPAQIRKQFADLSVMFKTIGALDRVLTLISS